MADQALNGKQFVEDVKKIFQDAGKPLAEEQLKTLEHLSSTVGGRLVTRFRGSAEAYEGFKSSLAKGIEGEIAPKALESAVSDVFTSLRSGVTPHDIETAAGASKKTLQTLFDETKTLHKLSTTAVEEAAALRGDARAYKDVVAKFSDGSLKVDGLNDWIRALKDEARDLKRSAKKSPDLAAKLIEQEKYIETAESLAGRFSRRIADNTQAINNILSHIKSEGETAEKALTDYLKGDVVDTIHNAVDAVSNAREAATEVEVGGAKLKNALAIEPKAGTVINSVKGEAVSFTEFVKPSAKTAEATKAAEGTLKTLFKNPVVKYGGIAAGLLIGAKLLGAFDSKEQSAAR